MRLLIIDGTDQFPVVRPNRFSTTTVRLTLAGIDEINNIYIAVVIAVIFAKIATGCLCGGDGINDKVCDIHIVLFVAINRALLTVIFQVVTQCDRTDYIKGRVIGIVRLRMEIIYCRTSSAVIIITGFVEHVIKSRIIIGGIESDIAKLYQYQQAARC